jgi:hypothetical protein
MPFFDTYDWVGSTDVEVEFAVADAETGQPLPGATVQVRQEPGGFCKDQPAPQFSLVADATGGVKRLSEHCMCFGTRGLGKDTFAVHLPLWQFQGSAPGYTPSEWIDLNDFDRFVRKVRRERGMARLLVTVELRKADAR